MVMPSPRVAGRSPASQVLRVSGLIVGALSLVNLVRDLGWVSFPGYTGRVMDAHAAFVARVKDALFGWIDVAWVEVTTAEAQAFVVIVLLISSARRVAVATGRGAVPEALRRLPEWGAASDAQRLMSRIEPAMGCAVGCLFYLFLVALLAVLSAGILVLEDRWSLGLAAGCLFGIVLAGSLPGLFGRFSWYEGEPLHRASLRHFRRPFFANIGYTVGLTLLIIGLGLVV